MRQNVASIRVLAGRNGDRVNNPHHGSPKTRDWRRIHHSPLFWIGLALCLAAIAIYLASEDLSWRPSGL
ncbi:MAG: uncharacterized protein JWR89_3840 [Tardiphaga sp.]|nr:uncharacterized protein [Tardiphaga sp.]